MNTVAHTHLILLPQRGSILCLLILIGKHFLSNEHIKLIPVNAVIMKYEIFEFLSILVSLLMLFSKELLDCFLRCNGFLWFCFLAN